MDIQSTQTRALELVALALVDLDTFKWVLVFGNGLLGQ
jgi:hypothetical protein